MPPRKDDPQRLYDEREVVEAVRRAIIELHREDHDLLIELRSQMNNVMSIVKSYSDDHEKRIRKVEKLINYGAGVLLFASWLLNHIKV